MKKRTLILSATAIVIALSAVPFAFAQMHGHRGPGGHAGHEFGGAMMLGHFAHAKEALGLSDQQVTDIKAIFQQLHDQNEPYRQSLRGGMQQIAATLLANPNDTAAAQALIDQQTSAERALKTNVLNATSKALNVLTADQRTKLASLIAERQKEHQSKMEQFRSRRGERGER